MRALPAHGCFLITIVLAILIAAASGTRRGGNGIAVGVRDLLRGIIITSILERLSAR